MSKRDGKVVYTASWVISDGGKTLTITSEGIRPDGSDYKNNFEATRVAGTAGLAGTWESTKVDPTDFPDFAIEPFEGDGLAFVTPAFREHDGIKFDGKDYPNEGPRVSPGATTSGKRLDAHTLELTDKLKGKVMDTQRVELSADEDTDRPLHLSRHREEAGVRLHARVGGGAGQAVRRRRRTRC